MRKNYGFTVIELIVAITFLLGAAAVLFFQINNLNAENANERRRTSINAIYFSLEEGFYKKNKYYPEKITEKTLPTMDVSLLKDPNGVAIGEPESEYTYEAHGCRDGKCSSYTLRATLEKDEEYTKNSKN